MVCGGINRPVNLYSAKIDVRNRSDVGKAELDTEAARERVKWEHMSTKDKIANFAARHQFSLIGSTWAASMLGAYGWISRDP